ncbi:DUF4123 domain-containing protein [Salmonella enterica subsp. salamae]|uniref:DUF4123 domain-containing protein n=1 Tax=Salmonella enterica subsp. salamae TaxID=59202 RepID=A0A5Y3V4E5_SALER|nr:DUF4123 domain-containing protein [Salmonella enterica subsp. salamae]EEO8346955.1 DUF4123 domain-containing protein [Salmonella enterica]ECI3455007.1 DUF4123 domain-containing protein [Salmonella enterica subsp. salamae]ECJ2328630.1 DUF4123 domain-containing protein [Salmonella enterica subsp. salamae]EDV0905550.1 DUF4123 domain-containing protein [Salmonella enterica subsp. salamae]
MEVVRYAIIDGAIESELLSFLQDINPPHCCLYSEPIQPDLVALAPYLVEVTPEVDVWLSVKDTPWGIYLTTHASMNTLRQHLRKYLQVLLPDETKPVLFRFYDPRNIWDFLSVLSEWETHLFFTDIQCIKSSYPCEKLISFSKLHEKYPSPCHRVQKVMRFSREQYGKFEVIFEKRYISELADYMFKNLHDIDRKELKIANDLFYYLRGIGIADRRSIEGISKLVVEKNIYEINDIPFSYRHILEFGDEPGSYRAEKLLMQVYGKIPRWGE